MYDFDKNAILSDENSISLLSSIEKIALVSITDPKGNIIYSNEKFSEISKYSQQELLGKNHNILKSYEQDNELFDDLWMTISSGKVWRGEIKNKAKDNTFYWIDCYITPILDKYEQPVKFVSISFVVDDRKKSEENYAKRLKDLEGMKKATLNLLEDFNEQATDLRKFKLAVDNSSDHIVITDTDGIILYANPAVQAITGYKVEEVLGKKAGASDLWGGLMPKDFYSDFWTILKKDKKPFMGTIKNKRKNGVEYYAFLSVTPIMDADKNIKFFVGIERDITREREIDRMKTEFISLASHQLRTPLSAMKWFLELLIGGDAGEMTPEQMTYVKNISQSNERMIDLVNSLLNISRIESGRLVVEPMPTKIDQLLNQVLLEVNENISNKKQKIIVSVHPDIPEINIDPKLITEVFVSLLSNAVKYTPENGEISVIISQKDDQLVCQVSDTGIGIPDSERGNVFTKFFRASNAVKDAPDGTGLGLYLAKTIIESSHGRMWFDSKLNQGTTFFFTLPKSGMRPKKGDVRLNS